MANTASVGVLPSHFEPNSTCAMKIKLIIGCLLVFAAMLVLLLYPQSKHQASVASSILETNLFFQSGISKSNNPVPPIQATNPPRLSPQERERQMEKMHEQVQNEWRTPIEFYGKVLDESNNPVMGAEVNFSVNDLSAEGTSFYHKVSDGNGLFSLTGITGKAMTANVSKEGYYAYAPHGLAFNYAGENQNFVPDAGNPVVFRLRKKGEGADLIQSVYPGFAHIAQLKHDGTPVELDLFQGKQASSGSGQLKLEFWRDISDKKAKKFDWKLQVSIPGGGLIGTDEQFPFNAPENGYEPMMVVDMSTNNPDWQGKMNTNKFYFELSDGKYGRFDFEFLPYNGVFTVTSFINPTGSRNLEPK
jgi:hypothetical protein